ncbi:hypothetical protein ACHHYP_10767 [Achlya hypogyna]|uniref:DUF2306 domain-containing protein n=1 Tax=Achlya hypogyna TaxID=1202772 RepID=A0A1V9YKK4_ACHHY|nr:hypothetical protein ACHHYP_10767 [Achlya hypogyna]
MEVSQAKAPTVHVPLLAHLIAVVPATAVGAIVLATRKGTRQHVLLGRIWTASMVTASVTSFGVKEVMPGGSFSPIHAFSVLTLASLGRGIVAIRQGNVQLHKRCMLGSFAGLIIAGVFTALPGRRMHAWATNGAKPWIA